MDHHIKALHWEVPGYYRVKSANNWRSIIKKELLKMRVTWKEAEVTVLNRKEWHWTVTQYIHLHTELIKV